MNSETIRTFFEETYLGAAPGETDIKTGFSFGSPLWVSHLYVTHLMYPFNSQPFILKSSVYHLSSLSALTWFSLYMF